ncbi:Carbohydrate kinase, FGGY [Treponema saccharophilum DSM 2985]|uniref:Carbohydrate kinase, FGGY n=2 Tax=Treponema saccharophilum TaxID=165 RepID=H7EKJ2_9SPIR|nr:Carbohydrate kinase, FGGY [Treponema saccharophilum DSM 2985]
MGANLKKQKENMDAIKNLIESGNAIVGIEFGSTRIKAVLIDETNAPVAQGSHTWENSLVDGIWTYSQEEIIAGLQSAYSDLKSDVQKKFGVALKKIRALGISAMMHGYLAFDKNGTLLVPFRTWRNTITGEASEKLSSLFCYPIPERWSISHLYQAILNKEPHVKDISFFTTLAGFIHWKLTGQKVLGIGDASGMFPIDTATKNYNKKFIEKFDNLVADKKFAWKLEDLLPKVLLAGEDAGTLTADGAKLLDPTGELEAGAKLAPPEGDAGTGMIATNSVAKRTGNVSAGTSVFAMVVLEKDLSKAYNGLIDLVTTPDGALVAMAHANNCMGEFDHWVNLFDEVLKATGCNVDKGKLYGTLLKAALEGDKDCGGLLPFNYLSGESITGLTEGRPLFVRTQHANFTMPNFIRAQLFTALGALRTGMDILFDKENVKIDSLTGHGGFFKTAETGLTVMSAALHTPVSALETAGEGGPWGMAVLASYLVNGGGKTLDAWLAEKVFATSKKTTVSPKQDDIEGFNKFFARYTKGLAIEKAAIESIE